MMILQTIDWDATIPKAIIALVIFAFLYMVWRALKYKEPVKSSPKDTISGAYRRTNSGGRKR